MATSRYSEDQIKAILKDAAETSIAAASKKHRVSTPTLYAWKRKYSEGEEGKTDEGEEEASIAETPKKPSPADGEEAVSVEEAEEEEEAPAAVVAKPLAPKKETPKPQAKSTAAVKVPSKGAGTAKAKENASKSAEISRMAVAAIAQHTLKTYKSAQNPLGLNRSPFAVISSGSLALNELIGGNLSPDGTGPICPGYPRRFITEIYGPEASGKTTLALEAVAEAQRQGGIAMYLDFEHALHHGYASKLGVSFDKNKLLLYQPSSMEEGLDMLKLGIRVGVDLVVVDSIAAMVPKADMEKGFIDADRIGSRAGKLASALPKVVKFMHEPGKLSNRGTALIFINQTRANIGGGPHASKSTTSGGYAMKFFAYLRLCTTRIASEFVESTDLQSGRKIKIPYGNKTQVKVIKSKVDAKQGHSCEIFIRYGQGIDDYYSLISTGVTQGVIKKKGIFFDYKAHHIKGREAFRAFLKDNTAVFEELRDDVLRAVRAQARDVDLDQEDGDLDSLLVETVGDPEEEESSASVTEEEISDEDLEEP